MHMDVVTLSRIQFALTIMFHYLFPPLTIGLGVVLVYLEGMYLLRKKPIYETAAKFWTQIYAVKFAMGVATGIVMEFQFGTNWAVYRVSSATCSAPPWPPRESLPSSSNPVSWPCWFSGGTRWGRSFISSRR